MHQQRRTRPRAPLGHPSTVAAFLVTGPPGVGKTTLVRNVVEALRVPASGFYTIERRNKAGERIGFDLVTLSGVSATLAQIGLKSEHTVGRYGVDLDTLIKVGVPAIQEGVDTGSLVVIDEIGSMELLAPEFQRVVVEAIKRNTLLLATIMLAAHPFADELKAQTDAQLFELTEANRDEVRGLVEAELRAATGQFSV